MPRRSDRARSLDLSTRHRRAVIGSLVAIAIALGAGIADVAVTSNDMTPLGLLAVVPFLAATMSSVRGTIAAGAVASAVVLAVAGHGRTQIPNDIAVVILGVIAATVVAAGTAALKRRRMRQLRDSREVANVVQQTMLRPVPERLGDIAICAYYSSATREADVGGDLYDVAATPFGVRVLLGDVKGKGLGAVHLASATLAAFREWSHEAAELSQLAERVERSVMRVAAPEEFVTGVFVQASDTTVEVATCGHPAPLLVRDGTAQPVTPDTGSLPLGLGVDVKPQRVAFAAGDRLLLYTDGVSEARRRDAFFDVVGEVGRLADLGSAELLAQLRRRLAKFTRNRLNDDIAILLLERVAVEPVNVVVPTPDKADAVVASQSATAEIRLTEPSRQQHAAAAHNPTA